MAKFCTECGKEIAAGVAFCTECGTKAPADPATATENTVPAVTETKVTPPPAVHTPPAQPAPKAQPVYAQPAPDPSTKVITTGTYFGLMFLFALPIIGFIICLIMCFAPKNKSLRNFAKATLIWVIIGLIVSGLIAGGIYLLSNTIVNYVSELSGGVFGEFGDMFEQFGDLQGMMEQYQGGDLEGLLEQYQNGGLEDLPIE